MPMIDDQTRLKRMQEARERQKNRLAKRQFVSENNTNMIIYGESGIGKTWLMMTARKPVLYFCLDPGGVDRIKNIVDPGTFEFIYVDKEDQDKPTQYSDFGKEFVYYKRAGYFDYAGTCVIDSMTTWNRAAMRQHIYVQSQKSKGAHVGKPNNPPHKGDYLPIMQKEHNFITTLCGLPCDVILLYHVRVPIREDDNKIILDGSLTFNSYGSNRQLVATAVGNIFRLVPTKGKAPEIQTQPIRQIDYDIASSCKWRDLLKKFEPPDIKALLKKGNRPYEDKEPNNWDILLGDENPKTKKE